MKKSKLNYLPVLTLLFAVMACNETKKGVQEPLLQSKIIIDTIFSENLNENRLISIYLPKAYTTDKTYPVIYSTDGQVIINFYKNELDSIIDNQLIPEFIMIGVHSNETLVQNSDFSYRNYEYIKGWAEIDDTLLSACFSNHYNFFSNEVLSYVEKHYSVSQKKEERIFYGTSNGAGFGVTFGSENPNVFANYICFSMAGGHYETVNWTELDHPYYYLSYGNKEPFPLIIAIDEFDEFLTQNNYEHKFWTYDGGHDRVMWKKEFFKTLIKLSNKK